MAGENFALVRNLLARGYAGQVGSDAPVAIRLRYVGTGTVTSVTVTTATNIVMITSDGGTDTYAFATYNTVGKLIDAINNDGIFEAKVLDSLRSFATASQFVTGAITASSLDSITIWDVKVDTSAAKYLALSLTYDRGFLKAPRSSSHRVHLQEFIYYATLGNASADFVQVWERTKEGTETQKLSYTSVSATATTINFANGYGKLTGSDGSEIVVVLKDDTSLNDAAANYLIVNGILE